MSRRKSAAYIEYVSILRRLTTRLLGVRCIFEIGSKYRAVFRMLLPVLELEKLRVDLNPAAR